MLLTQEWCGYAMKRKGLRVSSPKGIQRGTYRLQLPYRYGIPVLVGSGVLHWLVSQSIFLARINVFDSERNEVPSESVSTRGYSPIAIMFVCALGSIVILCGIGTGFRRYNVAVPLAGSCSAVISAACHPPQGSIDTTSRPAKWERVDNDEMDNEGPGVGQYSFT